MSPRFVASNLVRTTPRAGRWFVFRGHELMLTGQLEVPCCAVLDELGVTPLRTQYLGELDGEACFAAEVALDAQVPDGAGLHGIRSLFGRLTDEWMMLAGRALQIVDWD